MADTIDELNARIASLEDELERVQNEESYWEGECLSRDNRIYELEDLVDATVDARTDEDLIRIVEIAARAEPDATAYYLRRAGLIGETTGINALELILL